MSELLTYHLQRRLQNLRVAILATDGFEEKELTEPREALMNQGAHVDVVSLRAGTINGKNHDAPGASVHVDKTLSYVSASDYDALVLPGGVLNPDTLRTEESAVEFVRGFVEAGKPIGAICHGAWTLIEAGGVRGKKMTSWPSLKTDLRNAGALWADAEVIRDEQLVTSRKPQDLPAFNNGLIEVFSERRVNPNIQSRDYQSMGSVAPSAH